MRVMCEERELLWALYDKALKGYIDAVTSVARIGSDRDAAKQAAAAHEVVKLARQKITEHCRQHGCDPFQSPRAELRAWLRNVQLWPSYLQI